MESIFTRMRKIDDHRVEYKRFTYDFWSAGHYPIAVSVNARRGDRRVRSSLQQELAAVVVCHLTLLNLSEFSGSATSHEQV